MRSVSLLCVWAALAAGGFGSGQLFSQDAGDTVKVVAPDKVEPYRLVKCKVSGIGDKDSVIWKVRALEVANEGKIEFTLAGRKGRDLEWIAPPGRYRVEVFVSRHAGGFSSLDADERIVTIGQAAPAPKPQPKPDPKPKPEPAPKPKPKPEPEVEKVDAAIVAKLKPAVKDHEKMHVVSLGKVYYTMGVLLESSTDPAILPKNFDALVDRLTDASIKSQIPRFPALGDIRKVVSNELGEYDAMRLVDAAFAKELAVKYKRIGMALQEAGK